MKCYHSAICLLIYGLLATGTYGQSFISLSTGISSDLNNPHHSFHHIPVSLIWKPSKDERAPFLLEFDYDIPLKYKSSGDAYTLNPTLPGKVTLTEYTRPYLFTVSAGFRIPVYTGKTHNNFYLNFFPIGICNQKFRVVYKNYDKENYEVLNPDVSTSETGVVMSMGAVYTFHKTKQDMLLMLHLQTPLFKKKGDYLLSYKYIAPLQLTFGYLFYYNK